MPWVPEGFFVVKLRLLVWSCDRGMIAAPPITIIAASLRQKKNPLAPGVITVLHNLKIYKTLATCTYDCLLIAVMDQDLYTTEAPFLMVNKPATEPWSRTLCCVVGHFTLTDWRIESWG